MNIKNYRKCPEDYALQLIEEELTTQAALLNACIAAMSGDGLRVMLENHELSPRFIIDEEDETQEAPEEVDVVNGVQFADHDRCVIFVRHYMEHSAYVVKGGTMINMTAQLLPEGVDVDTLEDYDCASWGEEINTAAEFLAALRYI